MKNQTMDHFSAFATLHRYFTLTQTLQPTHEQASDAVKALCRSYGAENEEDLLLRGDSELISMYQKVKTKIMNGVPPVDR